MQTIILKFLRNLTFEKKKGKDDPSFTCYFHARFYEAYLKVIPWINIRNWTMDGYGNPSAK